MKKVHGYLKYPHLLDPTQFLVVWLFSGYHYAYTFDEIIEKLADRKITLNREELEGALYYFIEKDCLSRNPHTGKFFTLD